MPDLFSVLPEAARKKIRRRAQPAWCSPMLATLTREPFSDPGWLYEAKLDGIRCLAFRSKGEVRLFSRNKLSLTEGFPDLLPPLLHQQTRDFIVDGEIVAMKGGVSRFELLQKRGQMNVPIFYYLFDVLFIAGHDVTHLELRYRKELLRSALSFEDPLRLSEHRESQGEAFFREACRKGWEGLIAKRADSIYVHQRSREWLKFKCENQQEFVIIGYTEPEGQRIGIGALLVGVYENGALVNAGKVGTGFDTTTLRELEKKLKAIETSSKGKIHWVQPKLVAQIAFTEWTSAGKLRHPRYLGLRTDKKPAEVVREG